MPPKCMVCGGKVVFVMFHGSLPILPFYFREQVIVPEADDNVEYVSQTATVVTPVKRGKKLKADVPMEERLDNLSLTRQEAVSHKPPQADSMAHLLMQVCMPWQILCKSQ